MLIDSMSDKFDPKKYKDDYYEKVLEIIQLKVEGVTPAAPSVPKGPAKVVDLMEVLKQSLKETQKKVEEEPVTAERSSRPIRSRKAR